MFQTDNTSQAKYVGGIKKSALGVSLAMGLGGFASQPMAALSTSTLSFILGTAQTTSCVLETIPPCANPLFNVTDIVGSYFVMDNGDGIAAASEKTGIGSFNGIVIGTTQAAAGSHSGSINGSETPNIDNPWTFFGGTGMHQTTTAVTVNGGMNDDLELDMSGWNVNWNGIASIPLVQQGVANIACAIGTGCGNDSDYVLDATFHVSGAGFTTVTYFLHLEGTVAASGTVPITNDDSAKTIVGNPVTISVTDNDLSTTDPKFTAASVVSTDPAAGATVDNADNTITYTPDGPVGFDPFTYTVRNDVGTSASATVTVDVQANVAPVAVDDVLDTNTAALDNAGGTLTINVLNNDTDANNDPGLPGGIDTTSVTVLTGPCNATGDGTITYSQTPPSVPFTGTCTYTVDDLDPAGGALTSNTGTIDIAIVGIDSDWPVSLDTDIIPILFYDPGVPNTLLDGGNNSAKLPAGGSYFTMDIAPTATPPVSIHVLLEPGPAGGMVIGYEQTGGLSHSGAPDGTEPAIIEKGWNFFGNTGWSFSKNGGIVGNSNGTLEFAGAAGIGNSQGRYQITWNGIPEIDLGGSILFPEDLGFAFITCSDQPCTHGSTYELVYDAHVPDGDPSGFGRVKYGLRTFGTVGFLDGSPATSNGTVFSFDRLMTADVDPDADMEVQCVGGCFDYTITGVTDASVSVVIPLAGGIPATGEGNDGEPVPPELRKFDGTSWNSFDTSGTDTVYSASFVEGEGGLACPLPGDAAYGPMTEGHQCLEITIADNGPNDLDPALGTISDPAGLGIPEIEFIENRTSGTSGCTIATKEISPSHRSEWWLLAGFLAWLGWNRRKTQH